MVRPGSCDSVTELSSVATRSSCGIVMPTRWAAAPSSVGAGILLQSTSSRFFWFIALTSIIVIARSTCDEAIHSFILLSDGLLQRSLSAGAHSRDPLARNDG